MRICLFIFFIFVFHFSVKAGSFKKYWEIKRDSNYIESYYNDLIIRLYSGEKTHSIDFNDLNNPYHLKYIPNGYFNVGAGVNFRSFGLSLATKIPVFQNSEIRHGETKRFGIQSYIYAGKFSIDLLTSFLKGYYLNDSYLHLASFSKGKEYLRPDISSASVGISVNYIFNNARFSYKAAFNDTERQKRNAGSLIAGGSILSYQCRADSSMVPREIDTRYFLKSRYLAQYGVLAFNVNLGYAYSLIFLRNGIFTVSYILGSGIQENSLDKEITEEINSWRFSMNHTFRLGIGYRVNRYYIRFGVIRATQYTNLKFNDLGIGNGTNFMQFSIGRRISMKH